MNDVMAKTFRLERLLAVLLNYSSWVASTVMGLGFILGWIDSHFGTNDLAVMPNMRIATAGIVLFILLPTLRVLLMFVVFIREHDYRLALTSAVVLTIIVFGFVLGIRTTSRITE